ncbi:hypothetical protein [Metasolibacillus meyeri]|uniref:hypothetical protein n=1 Tax=Metasolibacillus meyeri TaxID=1071052 RepID=UPI000D2F7CDF|nr:hypothetical protein [Metasolibacillus meyeri]
MWNPTAEEIAYYKKIANDKNATNDEYYEVMLPLVLDMLNEQLCQKFTQDTLPSSLKIFLAKATNFFGGNGALKSRSMGSVSYSFNFTELPSALTDLLTPYNACRKAKFHVFQPIR